MYSMNSRKTYYVFRYKKTGIIIRDRILTAMHLWLGGTVILGMQMCLSVERFFYDIVLFTLFINYEA